MPFGNTLPIKVPEGPPDDRFVYLSDVLPTAWQAVQYAGIPKGGTRPRARPRADRRHGHPHRAPPRRRARSSAPTSSRSGSSGRARAASRSSRLTEQEDVVQAVRDATDGRGPDAVIDAVGMEAHGSPLASFAQKATAVVPDAIMEKVMQVAGVDRLAALNTAIEAVRRGGTISLSGVYGGATDPLPLMRMFDKQIQLRMGQANVWRWVPDILPLLTDEDPFGVDELRHAPRAARAGGRRLRQLPREEGRHGQGPAEALIGSPDPLSAPSGSGPPRRAPRTVITPAVANSTP